MNVVTRLQQPSNLDGYDRLQPPELQSKKTASLTFTECMKVRYAVFVREQHVPADSEVDDDDERSSHWVVFCPKEGIPEPGLAVGTIRLVPYPHAPHPVPGGVYASVNGHYQLTGVWKKKTDTDAPVFVPVSVQGPPLLPRRTTLHDGREPYVKLGRLAVLAKYRRLGLARHLVLDALHWMRTHPHFFEPRDARESGALPFKGLVCVHAQVSAIDFWQACEFEVDDAMGQWWEEGIPHVGMFLRL